MYYEGFIIFTPNVLDWKNVNLVLINKKQEVELP